MVRASNNPTGTYGDLRSIGRRMVVPIWAGLVAAGWITIASYSSEPGSAGHPTDWSPLAPLELDAGRPTVVLFVHPHCPCSRATVRQLARVVGHLADLPRLHVIAYRPESVTWGESDLEQEVQLLLGVTPRLDVGGRVAQAFGVEVSGHVLGYEPTGALRFSGGVTAGRGHEGDNPGSEALLDWLRGGRETLCVSAVFGCALVGPVGARGDR